MDLGEIEGSKLKEVFEYNTIFEEDGNTKVRLLQVSGEKHIFCTQLNLIFFHLNGNTT